MTTQEQEVTGIPSKHSEILRRVLGGQRLADISRETGISYSTLKLIVHRPAFKKEVERFEREIAAKVIDNLADPNQYLNQKVIKAAKKLVQLMENSQSEGIQMASANSILDRAGAPKISKIEGGAVTQEVRIDNRGMRLLLVSKLEAGLVPEEQKEQTIEMIKKMDKEARVTSYVNAANKGEGREKR